MARDVTKQDLAEVLGTTKREAPPDGTNTVISEADRIQGLGYGGYARAYHLASLASILCLEML